MPTTVCVYCASSQDVDFRYLDAAYRLGAALAREGATVVCGAGNQGLMRNLADGCLDNGGKAVGVIPKFMADNGWGYDALTQTVVTPDIHTRKERMAAMADAVVALPGGCGTLEELLEIGRVLQNVALDAVILQNRLDRADARGGGVDGDLSPVHPYLAPPFIYAV